MAAFAFVFVLIECDSQSYKASGAMRFAKAITDTAIQMFLLALRSTPQFPEISEGFSLVM